MTERQHRTSRAGRREYFSAMARVVATRSTCRRRAVGCVLVDRDGHVLATGYNGTPSGSAHCTDNPCTILNHPTRDASLRLPPSGTGLDSCRAVHAEANALIQCVDARRVETVYTTTSPCWECTKMLANTGARRIVYNELYPHDDARREWIYGRRDWQGNPERLWTHATTRPLVVGEMPISEDTSEEDEVLTGEEGGTSGLRLCRLAGYGDDWRRWCGEWDRTNVFRVRRAAGKWSSRLAAVAAEDMVARFDGRPSVVLLGKKVGSAFGFDPRSYSTLSQRNVNGVEVTVIPHPSGLNRVWNDPAVSEHVAGVMTRLAEAAR